MSTEELREEIHIELAAMQVVVDELGTLQSELANRVPTLREKTAAAAFLAQFYNGIENILKRFSLFHDVPIPSGETWHVELFQRFASPDFPDLPQLFDEELAAELAPYRRFRHVVLHSYGFDLDWDRMVAGVEGVNSVFVAFRAALDHYLQGL